MPREASRTSASGGVGTAGRWYYQWRRMTVVDFFFVLG
jgi:hypothetical protein